MGQKRGGGGGGAGGRAGRGGDDGLVAKLFGGKRRAAGDFNVRRRAGRVVVVGRTGGRQHSRTKHRELLQRG